MIGKLHLPLQHFDPLLAILNVAIEERDDDGGEYDHQLLDLQATLALEPTSVLGLLVLWAWMLLVVVVMVMPAQMLVVVLSQMLVRVVVVEGLETNGDDSAAPGDLYLLRFGGMVLLPLLLMYELT